MSDSLWPHELQHTRLPCHSLPEFAQTHVHWVSDAIQPSHPLSPHSPLALNLYQHQGLFQWVSSLHQVAKVLELQLQSISPPNEYLGFISFRNDWFDLLVVQGPLRSLLQHHSWKASILWLSALFIVQLSHLYMTTGKAMALTTWIYVSKMISCFLICCLAWFIIMFLPKSKHFLISRLQSLSTVILEPKEIKSIIVSTFPPSICHGTGQDLSFFNVEFQASFFTLLHLH